MTLIGIGSANNMERKTEKWQNGTPTTITRACYASFSLDESKVSLLAMPSLMYMVGCELAFLGGPGFGF